MSDFVMVHERRSIYGQLLYREYEVPRGKFQISAILIEEFGIELKGDGDDLIYWHALGQEFNLGRIKARVIEYCAMSQTFTCIRSRPGWQLPMVATKFGSFFGEIGARLVLTAAVWGLAEVDQATVPSWRDFKIVQWLRRRADD
jgi:hypothetical protein